MTGTLGEGGRAALGPEEGWRAGDPSGQEMRGTAHQPGQPPRQGGNSAHGLRLASGPHPRWALTAP